jgi:hypothetical protein
MQLLCDEGVDRQIVERLREEGHTVSYLAIWFSAKNHATAGVVLLRLSGLSPEKKAALTASAFARHADEMTDAFSVVSPGGVRTRSKP